MDLFAEQALWPNIIMIFQLSTSMRPSLFGSLIETSLIREAFGVLKAAGCSDEALCYEM